MRARMSSIAPQTACDRAARERVGRVGRELAEAPGRDLERGGALRDRLQHEARSGQDDSAAEHAVGVERVDRDDRARVDHDARRRATVSLATARRRAATSSAQRSRAELRGGTVAVDHAAAALLRDEPVDREPPARELAFDAHARGVRRPR